MGDALSVPFIVSCARSCMMILSGTRGRDSGLTDNLTIKNTKHYLTISCTLT